MSRWRALLHRTRGDGARRFQRGALGRLLLLAAALAGTWYLAAPAVLDSGERALWEKVRAAQLHLAQWRRRNGTAPAPGSDPWDCGLIGVEWSGITTTLGDLAAKRTACDPAWSVQLWRWLRELGLGPGDPVAIYASGSFPGMLLNAIAAAEASELDILMIVSLGASTWGANHADAPWPAMAAELRRGGFIRTRADYYTLGGGAETGLGLAPEGEALLRRAAGTANVPLLAADSLEDMVQRKTELLLAHGPRLLINIGGSQANLGDAAAALELQPGLLLPAPGADRGNGVIGDALRRGIPVVHALHMQGLAALTGIPYDAPPGKRAPMRVNPWWSLLGLGLFCVVLWRHRRWRVDPVE
jgi:poly-gamma-glutamate system protein